MDKTANVQFTNHWFIAHHQHTVLVSLNREHRKRGDEPLQEKSGMEASQQEQWSLGWQMGLPTGVSRKLPSAPTEPGPIIGKGSQQHRVGPPAKSPEVAWNIGLILRRPPVGCTGGYPPGGLASFCSNEVFCRCWQIPYLKEHS